MKRLTLPLAAVVGGAAALLLRLWQNRTGFEPDTGLPVPGALSGILLVLWLALTAAALAALVCRLPRETGDGPAFPAAFPVRDPGLFTLVIGGIFLMGASGVLELLAAVSGGGVPFRNAAVTPGGQMLMGALTLLSAVSLFPAAAACRRGAREEGKTVFQDWMLLVSPVCLVARLVLVYRMDSSNPAPEVYYVELLALVFLTLAFYRLSSFAYRAGRTRRFALYAALAAVLSMAALTDGYGLPDTLLYAGGALTALGFLCLRLACPPPRETSLPEESPEEEAGLIPDQEQTPTEGGETPAEDEET